MSQNCRVFFDSHCISINSDVQYDIHKPLTGYNNVENRPIHVVATLRVSLANTYWCRCYRSVVCMFVCLSRSCIVLKRQKISTRFSLHIRHTIR